MVTWSQVCRHRLAAHALDEPADPRRLVDVVRGMCGVHAQVASAAEVSIGVRISGITRQDVRDALWERRELARTYGLRGTVHLFPADELGLWLAALAAAAKPVRPTDPAIGLDDDQLAEVLAAIEAALADGRALTWRELGDEVVRRTGPWAGEEVFPAFAQLWPRWRPAVATAAARGLLVFGPNRGNQVTYLRTDRWLPGFTPHPDGAAALGTVALRYLSTYGPATPAQFAQWLGMLPSAASALFASLDLREVDVDGRRAWLPAAASSPALSGSVPGRPPVRLLPHFDAYLIGCHPRQDVFPGRATERALVNGSAGPVPALLVDGVVAGVWQHKRSGRRVAITVEPFVGLDADQHAELAAQAHRIGEIMQAEASLAIGEVTTRPHL